MCFYGKNQGAINKKKKKKNTFLTITQEKEEEEQDNIINVDKKKWRKTDKVVQTQVILIFLQLVWNLAAS